MLLNLSYRVNFIYKMQHWYNDAIFSQYHNKKTMQTIWAVQGQGQTIQQQLSPKSQKPLVSQQHQNCCKLGENFRINNDISLLNILIVVLWHTPVISDTAHRRRPCPILFVAEHHSRLLLVADRPSSHQSLPLLLHVFHALLVGHQISVGTATRLPLGVETSVMPPDCIRTSQPGAHTCVLAEKFPNWSAFLARKSMRALPRT